MLELTGPVALRLVTCILLGSIPSAIVAMMGTGIDIRQVGSGNPGFNNVLRVSKWRAVLTLVGDVGKGALAVWLVWRFWPATTHTAAPGPSAESVALGWVYGLAAILGHCYSPFLKFNGGKGIAVSGGVMLVLYPMWAVVALMYFTLARLTMGKIKWPESGMIASISTWVLFTFLMLAFVGHTDATFAALTTLFLAWRHKKNFHNLLAVPRPSK